MRTDYNERKELKIDRFHSLAVKNDQDSTSAWKRSNDIVSCIPLGQPILVGHHSEGRHRRAIEKSHNAMRASVEASKKADYYRERAEAAESNTAISSDNPDALDLLRSKVEKLEGFQENMKAANKIIKSKKMSDVEKVAAMSEAGIPEKYAVILLEKDDYGRIGFPSYKLTNNNANIRRLKERIQILEKRFNSPEQELEIGDVKIVASPDKNRVQIFFPDKPAEHVRKEMRKSGFIWAPTEMAWQKMFSNWAMRDAVEIVKRNYSPV